MQKTTISRYIKNIWQAIKQLFSFLNHLWASFTVCPQTSPYHMYRRFMWMSTERYIQRPRQHHKFQFQMLILSTRDNNIIFAELAATNRLEPHIAAASGRRPAEKSYFSKSMRKRSKDRSRDRSSDRSSDRSRESFRSMRRKLYQLS